MLGNFLDGKLRAFGQLIFNTDVAQVFYVFHQFVLVRNGRGNHVVYHQFAHHTRFYLDFLDVVFEQNLVARFYLAVRHNLEFLEYRYRVFV